MKWKIVLEMRTCRPGEPHHYITQMGCLVEQCRDAPKKMRALMSACLLSRLDDAQIRYCCWSVDCLHEDESIPVPNFTTEEMTKVLEFLENTSSPITIATNLIADDLYGDLFNLLGQSATPSEVPRQEIFVSSDGEPLRRGIEHELLYTNQPSLISSVVDSETSSFEEWRQGVDALLRTIEEEHGHGKWPEERRRA